MAHGAPLAPCGEGLRHSIQPHAPQPREQRPASPQAQGGGVVGKGLPIHGGTPVPCTPTVTPRKQSTASQHHSDRTQRSPISHGTAPRSADPKAVGTQKQPHSTLHPKNRRTPRHAPKTAAPRKRLHTASHPDSRGTPGAATPRALPSRRRPTNQPHPNSEAPLGAPQVGPHPAPPQKTRPPPGCSRCRTPHAAPHRRRCSQTPPPPPAPLTAAQQEAQEGAAAPAAPPAPTAARGRPSPPSHARCRRRPPATERDPRADVRRRRRRRGGGRRGAAAAPRPRPLIPPQRSRGAELFSSLPLPPTTPTPVRFGSVRFRRRVRLRLIPAAPPALPGLAQVVGSRQAGAGGGNPSGVGGRGGPGCRSSGIPERGTAPVERSGPIEQPPEAAASP